MRCVAFLFFLLGEMSVSASSSYDLICCLVRCLSQPLYQQYINPGATHLDMGQLHVQRGETAKAEAALGRALQQVGGLVDWVGLDWVV